MPGSSTTALGHSGTGVGTHAPSWAHYKAPASGDSRVVHTRYDYSDANQKIAAADAPSGSVQVKAWVYRKTTTWKCGNGTCPGSSTAASRPARSGCSVARSGEHTWNQRNVWAAGAQTTKTLYYNKSGATTQVSYHSTP